MGPFENMTSMEKRSYHRQRGPNCTAGAPIKEMGLPTVTGDRHQRVTWHSKKQPDTPPIAVIPEIPGKYALIYDLYDL